MALQPSARRFVSELSLDMSQAMQDTELANTKTRLGAVETLGGLAPGDVSDATITNLLANDVSGARKEAGKHFTGMNELVINAARYMGFAANPAQAAIDNAPDYSEVLLTAGIWDLDNVRHDGSAGNKIGITLKGAGMGVTFVKQPGTARALIPGYADNTQSPNVIEARTGRDFILKDMTVIANGKTGGIKPARAMQWLPSTLYTYNPTVPLYRVTKADGTATTGTDKDPNLTVWRLVGTHTSNGGTNINPDAASWVVDTGFGALNYYWYGESFNRNHGISYTGDKATGRITNVKIENVDVRDAPYASILMGTGAVVHDDYKTAGVDDFQVLGCHTSGSAAGVGGGHKSRGIISNCHISASSNLINVDEGSEHITITGNIIYGDAILGGSNGISSYQSAYVNVSGNTVTGCNQGINFQDSPGTSSRSGSISGNTIVNCGTAIAVSGDNNTAVVANTIHSPLQNGIKISDCFNVTVVGNTVQDSGFYGIQGTGGHGNSVTGNTVCRSQRDGFYFHGISTYQIIGNQSESNNMGDTTDGSGFRILGDLSSGASGNNIVSGNNAMDYNSPKKQKYGLYMGAGVTGTLVQGNNFLSNLTAPIYNAGSGNTIGFNKSSTTAFQTSVGLAPETDNNLGLGTTTRRWMEAYITKLIGYDGTRSFSWTVGDPNGTIVGSPGDIRVNASGGAGKTLYVKETGVGTNTGWVGK